MIGIIDYGMGNLKSVCNALESLNINYIISGDIKRLKECCGLILPGVGAFKDAMDNIKSLNLDTFIKDEVKKNKPLLGICLGMQLLFNKSFEIEEREGLNLLEGEIIKLNSEKVRVPHIGWNNLTINKEDNILNGLKGEKYMYYVHSYYASKINNNDLIAFSDYGEVNIPGIVRKENVIGAQFHPEKSGDEGLKILKNFYSLCKGE